jgi:hypothetical protein
MCEETGDIKTDGRPVVLREDKILEKRENQEYTVHIEKGRLRGVRQSRAASVKEEGMNDE